MSETADYLSQPLSAFLADAGAKSPTPGGGSVAAVVGALAASLARMAVAYTAGKPRFAEHQDRLEQLLSEFQEASAAFGELIREDMVAYREFAASRKADDPAVKERSLMRAITVPMEIVALAGAIAARTDEIKSFTNPYLLSDLRAAAILAAATADAAATSVRVNLPELADRREAERIENKLDLLLARAARHRDTVAHYEVPDGG